MKIFLNKKINKVIMAGRSNFTWDEHSHRVVAESRQVLERTSASLARSNQVAIETEHIGTEVLSELSEQRESLLRSQRRLISANDDLTQTGKVLRAIQKNVLYNKLTLALIIMLEICILVGLLYIRLK